MRTFQEWCVFFQDINNDPAAITPRLTVRDLLAAKSHIHSCEACMTIVDKVLGQAPIRSVIDDANPN